MSGNLIYYSEDVSTPTAHHRFIKIFLKSIIPTQWTLFANSDISNFKSWYHWNGQSFQRWNCLINQTKPSRSTSCMKRSHQIDVIVKTFSVKCMACLKLDHLVMITTTTIKPSIYIQSQFSLGLWHRKTCKLQFELVDNDFGIIYIQEADLNQLI